jgi:hypothetical protein
MEVIVASFEVRLLFGRMQVSAEETNKNIVH